MGNHAASARDPKPLGAANGERGAPRRSERGDLNAALPCGLAYALTTTTLLFLPAVGTAAPSAQEPTPQGQEHRLQQQPQQQQQQQPQQQQQQQQQPQQEPQPSPRAQRPEAAPVVNVRVDVTLTDQTGAGQPFTKNVGVVVAATNTPMGSAARSRSAVQVPVRTTTVAGDNSGAASPVVAYSYRNMSLNLDVSNVTVEGNRVQLHLAVEYSPVDERTAEARDIETLASFASFQQAMTPVLGNG